MIRLLRNLFVRDWMLKLFSLTLAVLTWLAVSFSLRQRVVPLPGQESLAKKTYFDLPVTILSHGSDVSEFKVKPAQVDITVQGSEAALQALPPTNIRVIVDVSGTVLKSPQLLPVEVVTPAGISHILIEPENLVQVTPPPAPKPETENK